jgi:hypothetical protein
MWPQQCAATPSTRRCGSAKQLHVVAWSHVGRIELLWLLLLLLLLPR